MAIALERGLAARLRFVLRIFAITLGAVLLLHLSATAVAAVVGAGCVVVFIVAMAIALERGLAARLVLRIFALALGTVLLLHISATAVAGVVGAGCVVVLIVAMAIALERGL